MGEIVKLKNVRISFPQIFEPKQFKGMGKPSFSASFLFERSSENFNNVMAAIKKVAEEKWGDSYLDFLRKLNTQKLLCLHNGDHKPDWEGYPGNYFVSVRSYIQPRIFDRNKTPLKESDGKIYPGCRVNAVFEVWAQDSKAYGVDRINATFGNNVKRMGGVQFVEEDDAFVGGASSLGSDDDFTELAMDESEDAFSGTLEIF